MKDSDEAIELRASVQAFAEMLELHLRDNEHKEKWAETDAAFLLSELTREYASMQHSMASPFSSKEGVVRCGVNLAALTLMIIMRANGVDEKEQFDWDRFSGKG